jgi:hypothetical protein
LVGAVNAGWTIGGMGWWNDRSFKDADLQREFEELTYDYYEAMSAALYAACDFNYR